MPCESGPRDYAWEGFCDAVKHFNYVAEKTGNPKRLDAHKDYRSRVDSVVQELCAMLSAMSPDERDAIIYDARNKTARSLADWWEYHQEMDAEREAEKLEAERIAKLREEAASKLTPEERAAVGLKNNRR